MKDFFGINGYERSAEGFLSWQHIVFISSLLILMILLSVCLGLRNRTRTDGEKNKVIIGSALALIITEAVKYIILGIVAYCENDVGWWKVNLPLFLCSIQLFTLPVSAFAKGRLKEAALDFVMLFGILGALLGTFGAAQNYNSYPVISFHNVASALTHVIAGFASLYIIVAGMGKLRRRSFFVTCSILLGICTLAFIANELVDYNYMFLKRGDGTPYDILYNLVGGHPVLYPIGVVLLFLVYIFLFYGVHDAVKRHKKKKAKKELAIK